MTDWSIDWWIHFQVWIHAIHVHTVSFEWNNSWLNLPPQNICMALKIYIYIKEKKIFAENTIHVWSFSYGTVIPHLQVSDEINYQISNCQQKMIFTNTKSKRRHDFDSKYTNDCTLFYM